MTDQIDGGTIDSLAEGVCQVIKCLVDEPEKVTVRVERLTDKDLLIVRTKGQNNYVFGNGGKTFSAFKQIISSCSGAMKRRIFIEIDDSED
jgi:predicted RNA-binding protein YlqC (UPF0109 family)